MNMSTNMYPSRRRPIGYWAKRLDTAIDAAADRALAGMGSDRRQWQILTTLLDGPAGRSDLLGALSPFAGESVTPQDALSELAAKGLVSEDDGRVALTAEGRETRTALADAVGKVRGVVAHGVSDEEYTVTVAVLERMVRNLDADAGRATA